MSKYTKKVDAVFYDGSQTSINEITALIQTTTRWFVESTSPFVIGKTYPPSSEYDTVEVPLNNWVVKYEPEDFQLYTQTEFTEFYTL